MTMVEAVSFALGAASMVLGLLAIWLSIHFYTRDQALFVETQRTLGDIQYTARSVEHATEQVLAKAIDYLTNRPPTVEEQERLGDAVNRAFARAMRPPAGGHAPVDLTPEAVDELRRTVERIIAEYDEHRRAQDTSDAFWQNTVSESRAALSALRGRDGDSEAAGASPGRDGGTSGDGQGRDRPRPSAESGSVA